MKKRNLLHRVRGSDGEQLATLLQGVGAWNSWRTENPDAEIELSGVDLRADALAGSPLVVGSGTSLRGINLRGAVLHDAHLESADLYGADLRDAYLGGAHLESAVLQSADLQDATLSGAQLEGASLVWANLRGALLQGAHLKGAELHHADFREADLRGAKGLVFDESYTVHAIAGLAAKDPWSILRRKYTGVMLLFHLLFLVAFLLPYVGRVGFWRAINHGQVLYSNLSTELVDDLRRLEHEKKLAQARWHEAAEAELAALGLDDVKVQRVRTLLLGDAAAGEFSGVQGALSQRFSRKLERMGPCLRESCTEIPVWRVLLQLDSGILAAVLALSLLLYNGLRALMTWQVGLMRDEEERSGLTPPWRSVRLRGRLRTWLPWPVVRHLPSLVQGLAIRDTEFVQLGYRPFYQTHRVLTAMFWSVVAVSIAYNAWNLLSTTVMLPSPEGFP